MHIGLDLKSSHFAVSVQDRPSTREALLEWGPQDRLGIVVDRPFGALDATLMILLAGTAFYDVKKQRRRRQIYPDAFLFHRGGPWGAHTSFDFVPDHKEIVVLPSAQEMLRAINHVGITHLLVPECTATAVKHRFKEPEAALDRIKKVFVYGKGSIPAGFDVTVSTTTFEPIASTISNTLEAAAFLDYAEQLLQQSATHSQQAGLRTLDPEELRLILPAQRARLAEVGPTDPERLRHVQRLAEARRANRLVEYYRRIDTGTALMMLH